MNESRIYIPFPRSWPTRISGEPKVPDNILEWLFNKEPNWGVLNGRCVGVFLKSEDAVAFKLTFNL